MAVVELGEGVVLVMPSRTLERLVDGALSAEDLAAFVEQLDDPDLATT